MINYAAIIVSIAGIAVITSVSAEQSTTVQEKSPSVKTEPQQVAKSPDTITTTSGLKFIVIKKGTGSKPVRKTRVKVHYTGKFLDGRVFDSSVQRGEPFEFNVGVGMVIAGWDEAVLDMKKGEKRTIVVPSSLAYGEDGAGGGLIPSNATLLFDIELLGF